MEKEKIFTREELQAMGERTLDLVQAAVEAGDKEAAKKLSKRMYAEFTAMHDLYRDWVTDLLSFIGRRYGDEDLYEVLKQTVGGYTKMMGLRYAGKSTKRKLEMLAAGLRGHLQPLTIEEDDEKFTIIPKICGSGGRLAKEGAYGPPRDFLKIKKAQAMTFDQEDWPVYCSHCHFQNIIPLEPGGSPLFITEPSTEIGEKPCRTYVYK